MARHSFDATRKAGIQKDYTMKEYTPENCVCDLLKEKEKIEQEIISLTEEKKQKRFNLFKHKKGEGGYLLDCEEMIITDGKIGTTNDNKEFRIDRFKDGSFGFFINTNTQGNFVLNKKEMIKLKEFLYENERIR